MRSTARQICAPTLLNFRGPAADFHAGACAGPFDMPSAIRILATAAIYSIAARLALWMAIPPGYATAVWPAAGLGLICVLAWGPRAAVGIAVASCLVNLGTSFDDRSALVVVRSFAIAGSIGLGAGLQACLGAELIRRRMGFPALLDDEHDIVWFIALGGPIASLVSSTIGVMTLALAGVIGASGLAFSWWTWWVGDTIGVLVFAPLALLAIPVRHPLWRRRRGIVGLPLVLGFAAVTALFVRVSAWERVRLHTDFERRVAPVAAVLKSQLSKYEEVVTSLPSLFRASADVTRDEFHEFCALALAKYPAVLALSWNPRVLAAQRGELEARARGDGLDDFSFTELAPDGGLRVAGPRAEYVPVYFIEPQPSNLGVLGYDVASDPVRREVLERASSGAGDLAATPRLQLVQDVGLDAPPAVLLVAPVRGRSDAHPVRGYVVGVFRLRDIFDAALLDVDHDGMNVALVDHSAAPSDARLYTTGPPAASDAAAQLLRAQFAFGDRQWQLEIAPTDAARAAQRSWQAWTVLAAGLLFVGLLGVVLLIATGRAYRSHEGSERFRALVEASAQIVWTTNAVGEVTEDSPSWRAFTGQTFEQWRGWGRHHAIHPDDRARAIETWDAAVAAQAPVEQEYRLRHTTGEWRWTAARAVPLLDPHGGLRGWVTSNTDITARKLAEAERESILAQLTELNGQLEQRVQSRTSELMAALREREVLLQEVHHRVKNNLQVISSLISMQVRKLDQRADREALEECQTRIQAIALIHEQLYQSRDYAKVPFSEYTRTLVRNVFHTMGSSPGAIELDLAIDDVSVPVDKAIPCGLLLNELITNALKHAFKDGRHGELRVELAKVGPRLRLVVQDNGVGLPVGLDIRGTDSFGLQLVMTLVDQLDATLAVRGTGGARFELEFAVES
jgi:PAS domain S-box-containing protein